MTKFLRLTWTIFFSILISGAGVLFADCPEGARPTTDEEKQQYLTSMEALTASLPSAPDGWHLEPVKVLVGAPASICKGSQPLPAVDATYISLNQQKQNEEFNRDYEARINTLRQLSPGEQKEADTLYRQGSDLGYKSIAELKNKNQSESDRLRAEANKAYAASKAIQTAHLEKVFPQIRALQEEQRAQFVSPEVRVHLIASDLAQDQKTSKTESVRIEGLAKAYYTPDKTLAISLGATPDGQPMWAQILGDRKETEAIARLFGDAANKRVLVKSQPGPERQKNGCR